jgi:hypothetical protein
MHRPTSALAATALAAGLLGLAPQAQAAPTCPAPAHPIDGYGAVDVAVGTKKVVTVDLDVAALQGEDVEGAVAHLSGPRRSYHVTLEPGPVPAPGEGPRKWSGSVRLDPRDLRNSDAGTWELRYTVTGNGTSESVTTEAKIRRATRATFNAGPEPVRHDRLTFSGQLERASWNTRHYSGVSKTVVVRMVDAGGEEDADVVTLETRSDGTYRRTVAFPGPNRYWLAYEGGTVSAPTQSRVDRVDAP